MCAKLSRGLRNLNPGNIRHSSVKYKGEREKTTDKEFKQFRTIEEGYRAMFVLLYTYCLKGFDTIERIIERYAPPSENNTEAYINRVCRLTFIPRNQVLDTSDRAQMSILVSAISLVENCAIADDEQIASGWRMFACDYLDQH